jgi:hypothetical protein
MNSEQIEKKVYEELTSFKDEVITSHLQNEFPDYQKEAKTIVDIVIQSLADTPDEEMLLTDEEIDSLPCLKRYLHRDEKAVADFKNDVNDREEARIAKEVLSAAIVSSKQSSKAQLSKVLSRVRAKVEKQPNGYPVTTRYNDPRYMDKAYYEGYERCRQDILKLLEITHD